MSRSATRTSALLFVAGLGTASAEPGVDVEDLPPLPPGTDEPSTSATTFAASAVEEEVVVGAAKREQSLGNVASAVTVVSGDRLRRFGYRTIGEAVAAVAGVYLVDNRLSYSVGVRGMQIPGDFNTRILVLVDGASINEAWGAFAGLGFDAICGIDEVARLEVIRGPVSSVYGTNAFFGIINIVTRGAAETPRAWGRTSYNSINGVISAAGFAAGGVHQQIRGSVSFMNRFGEDTLALPDGGDTHFKGDGSQSYSVGVVGAYGGTFGQVRASKFSRESPFAPYDVFPADKPYNQIDRHLLVEGGHTRTLSKRLVISGRGYTNLYSFRDISPPNDPTIGFPLETTGTAQTIGGEIRGRYEIVLPDRLGITLGSEVSNNHTRSTAFLTTSPDMLIADTPRKFNLGGIYSELDGQVLPWLGFVGGVRVDIHSELEDRISPRAALFASQPDRYGVKLLYAQGFRNPSAFEAFFEDGADFIADPKALKAEVIKSYELVGWARPKPGLSTRVSVFYWDSSNIIEASASPLDPSRQQFQNVTRFVSRGLEAEGSYRNSRGWYGFGGAALAQVGTENAMGELVFGTVTNAPAITAGIGVSTPKLLGRTHVSLEGILLGERPTRPDFAGNASPNSPAWVGLNLTAYTPNVRGFDVTAGVRNLIGRRDQMPSPPDYDRSQPDDVVIPRVPGEGREIYVKVGYSY